jgi:hypothetical protein
MEMDGRVLIYVGEHPDDYTDVMESDILELLKALAQYPRHEIAVSYEDSTVSSALLNTRQVVYCYQDAWCMLANGEVAGKEGSNPQYKLMEASEEFDYRMTLQRDLLTNHSKSIPRTDRSHMRHCAMDDAFNTVRLTGLLMEDFAGVDLLSSLELASLLSTVWPPEGLNTSILSIDSCTWLYLPRGCGLVRSHRCEQWAGWLERPGLRTLQTYPLALKEGSSTLNIV